MAGPWESPHSKSVLYTITEWPLGASTVGAYTLYTRDPCYIELYAICCMLYAIHRTLHSLQDLWARAVLNWNVAARTECNY